MKHFFRRLLRRFHHRTIILDRPLLTEREIREAFTVPETEPIWLAFHQCLEKVAQDCREELTDPDAADNPGLMAHHAGALNHLDKLQDWLYEIRAEAFAARSKEEDE